MLFNGAQGPGAETVTMTANGGRLIFFRQPGNVTMSTDKAEIVDFNGPGGPDSITVNRLSSTDVTQTNLDVAGAQGGNNPDGQLDSVVDNGTDGVDDIDVAGNGSGADVRRLATAVSIKHADPTDSL